MFSTFRVFVILWVALSVVACGRKAAPRPPEDVMPKTIADLSASSTAEGIELAWSRPRTYADGSPLSDLGGFVIERITGLAPNAAFERVATLEVDDRDRFRQIKRFRHVDRATNVGTRYRYRVVSFTVDRYFSAPSNVATVERTATGEDHHAPLRTPRR